jgi:hypothetical protein
MFHPFGRKANLRASSAGQAKQEFLAGWHANTGSMKRSSIPPARPVLVLRSAAGKAGWLSASGLQLSVMMS